MLFRALDALHAAAHRYLPPSLRQFVKFGMVGSVGFIVDMGTFAFLYTLLRWTTVFTVAGYEVIAANTVSVLAAMVAVFLLNKFWTFRDPRAAELARQGSRFFALYLTTYILNQILTSFFAFRVPVIQTIFHDAAVYVAKVLAISIILFVNFFGSKFVVFRGLRPMSAPDEGL